MALLALPDVWIKCPKRFLRARRNALDSLLKMTEVFCGRHELWNLWRCPLHCRCTLARNIDSYCTCRFLMSLKSRILGSWENSEDCVVFLATKSEFEDVSHECSFELPTCCYLILLCCEVSVPMEKAANLLVFDCFKRGCNLVSCGMRGTF